MQSLFLSIWLHPNWLLNFKKLLLDVHTAFNMDDNVLWDFSLNSYRIINKIVTDRGIKKQQTSGILVAFDVVVHSAWTADPVTPYAW